MRALLLLLVAAPAMAYEVTVYGDTWDLYVGRTKHSEHDTRDACHQAAVALGEGRYGCRTRDWVTVTADTEPVPEPIPEPEPTPEPEPEPTPIPSSWLGVPYPAFGLTETGTVVNRCGTYNGTAEAPVVIRVTTTNDCDIYGSYIIVEHSDLREVTLSGHHIAIRDSHIHNADNGAMLFVRSGSTDVVIFRNEIDHNGIIPSTRDNHGITLGSNTDRAWILDNYIHENSGDSIQFCHGCIGDGNGPLAVYISGNRMHDDEENALDFKEFRGPLIVTNNEMWGYERSADSNGDAFRINDEGNQGELWAVGNVCHDNNIDINAQGARAESYILDNQCTVRDGRFVASGPDAEQYYQLYEQKYGLSIRSQ